MCFSPPSIYLITLRLRSYAHLFNLIWSMFKGFLKVIQELID